jgi:hypothetical protein
MYSHTNQSQRYEAWSSSCCSYHGVIAVKKGFNYNNFISWASMTKNCTEQCFISSSCDEDFSVWINFPANKLRIQLTQGIYKPKMSLYNKTCMYSSAKLYTLFIYFVKLLKILYTVCIYSMFYQQVNFKYFMDCEPINPQ